MLKITVDATEVFNDETSEFSQTGGTTIELEHSLVSLASWESKWEKSFLGSKDKTSEETLDYIRCMALDKSLPEDLFERIPPEEIRRVNDYLSAKMTATTFGDDGNQASSRQIITAEIIYSWMVGLNVPFECQYWHLTRLITLVRVLNVQNAPKKKSNPHQIAGRNRAINDARKKQLGTTG